MKAFNRSERRLRQKFYYLKMEMLTNKKEGCEEEIINQAETHKRKVVWNLSGIHIPPETEGLLGRLGMNFQFAPKKFPALEIVQSTELICQRIEKYETTDQRLLAINKERAQRIRNIVVSHVQRNYFKRIKQNTTHYERKLLSDFQKIPEIVTIPADKALLLFVKTKMNMSGKKMIYSMKWMSKDLKSLKSNFFKKHIRH